MALILNMRKSFFHMRLKFYMSGSRKPAVNTGVVRPESKAKPILVEEKKQATAIFYEVLEACLSNEAALLSAVNHAKLIKKNDGTPFQNIDELQEALAHLDAKKSTKYSCQINKINLPLEEVGFVKFKTAANNVVKQVPHPTFELMKASDRAIYSSILYSGITRATEPSENTESPFAKEYRIQFDKYIDLASKATEIKDQLNIERLHEQLINDKKKFQSSLYKLSKPYIQRHLLKQLGRRKYLAREEGEQEQETTVNLMMLATDEHRSETTSVLTELEVQLAEDNHHFKHLINGIGGQLKPKKDDDEFNKDNIRVGRYDFNCYYDFATDKLKTDKKQRGVANAIAVNRAQSVIFGTGRKDVIQEAVMVVETMLLAGKEPIIFNLFGFSRGADSTLRIANELYRLYPERNIKINILAIDPVAGPGDKKHQAARLIPPNVANYEVVLMEHEHRVEMTPQDKFRIHPADPNTNIKYHLLGGYHAFATKTNSKDKNRQESAKLLWDLVQRFARNNGNDNFGGIPFITHVKKYNGIGGKLFKKLFAKKEVERGEIPPELTDHQRLSLYSDMRSNEKYFPKLSRSTRIPIIGVKRELSTNRQYYFLHGSDIFQDKQHMDLFRTLFPCFFDHFFQQKIDAERLNYTDNDLIAEIELLRQPANKAIKDCLIHGDPEKFGFLKQAESITAVPPAQGIYLSAAAFYKQPNKLRDLWENLQYIIFPIFVSQDQSLSKHVAQGFLNRVYDVITNEGTDEAKIKAIKHLARSLIVYHHTSHIFENKLMSFFEQKPFDPLNEALQFVEHHKPDSVIANILNAALVSNEVIDIENGKNKERANALKSNTILKTIHEIKCEDKSCDPNRDNIISFLLHQVDRYHYGSIADRLLTIANAYLNSSNEINPRDKIIIEKLVRALEQMNKINKGNDAVNIRRIIDKAITKLDPNHLNLSTFAKVLKNTSFYQLNVMTNEKESDYDNDDVKRLILNFTKDLEFEMAGNITATIKSDLNNNVAASEEIKHRSTTPQELQHHIEVIQKAITQAEERKIPVDARDVNTYFKVAKKISEIAPPTETATIKTANEVLNEVKEIIKETSDDEIYTAPRILSFLCKDDKQDLTINRTNRSEDAKRSEFVYTCGNKNDHEGFNRCSEGFYAHWAKLQVEQLRSDFLSRGGDDKKFKVEINAGMKPLLAKNIALYCASQSIPFEDHVHQMHVEKKAPSTRTKNKFLEVMMKYEMEERKKQAKANKARDAATDTTDNSQLDIASISSAISAGSPHTHVVPEKHVSTATKFLNLFKAKDPLFSNYGGELLGNKNKKSG